MGKCMKQLYLFYLNKEMTLKDSRFEVVIEPNMTSSRLFK